MRCSIRYNLFETNSSSTHSLVICSRDEFEKWKNGKLFLNTYTHKFKSFDFFTDAQLEDAKENYIKTMNEYMKFWQDLTEDERKKYCFQFLKDTGIIDEDYESYDEYMTDTSLETFAEQYTSKSGDNIVVFGRYGYC